MNTRKPDRGEPLANGPLLSIDDTILELLPTAVYVCDAEGVIVRYNRRATQIWGRAPREGETDERFWGSYRLYEPEGRRLSHDATPMAEVLKTGLAAHDREVIVEQPDGRRILVSVNIEPMRGESGEVAGAICALQDITARKQAERNGATLAGREIWFRDLLEALPAAIYTTDAEGRVTFYNEAAATLWGHRPELDSGKWCGSWRLYWPDGTALPHDQCPMAVALKEERVVRDVEAIAERPDGSRVPFMPYPTLLRDASGALVGAVNMLVDLTAVKRAEERQQLLIHELNHRVKNTLVTVQSIAAQSFLGDGEGASHERFEERLVALSKAHDVLTRGNWEGASLHEIISQSVAPLCSGDEDRLDTSGPYLRVRPRMALPLAMAFHELCTNAVRFGSLSKATGRVAVEWRVVPNGEGKRLFLRWAEHDGPTVGLPRSRGFGSRLIERGLARELNAEIRLDYARAGLVCEIDAPLH